MRRLPFILAIALTALVASAAGVGAERLITGADIKDGSITGRDIKRGSLKSEHLEAAARHRVFVANAKRARQMVSIGGNGANVVSLKVPAGNYAIQAMASITNGSGETNLTCQLTDSAGIINKGYFEQQWITPTSSQTVPIALVGVASYTAQTTVYINCYASQGSASAFGGTIVAEQVTSDTAT